MKCSRSVRNRGRQGGRGEGIRQEGTREVGGGTRGEGQEDGKYELKGRRRYEHRWRRSQGLRGRTHGKGAAVGDVVELFGALVADDLPVAGARLLDLPLHHVAEVLPVAALHVEVFVVLYARGGRKLLRLLLLVLLVVALDGVHLDVALALACSGHSGDALNVGAVLIDLPRDHPEVERDHELPEVRRVGRHDCGSRHPFWPWDLRRQGG